MIREKILPLLKTQLEKWVFLHRNEYDLLWAIDFVSLPSVIKGAKGSKVPVVYETLDLVAEYPYNKRLQRLRRSWERNYLPKVAALITAGNEYARYYQRQYSYNSPITVVHNYAPAISNTSSLKSDSIKFLFFGNIMFDRPIDMLIEAFSEVQGSHTLTIMGVNYLGEAPESKIKALGLDKRVRIIPPVNPLEGPTVASGYDVGIAMLNGNDMNERLAPTAKLGTYLAAGLGIVATNLPGMREELKDVKALFAEAGNIDSWIEILNQLVSLPENEINEMKKSSFAFAQNNPLEKELVKYSDLFEQLFGQRQV